MLGTKIPLDINLVCCLNALKLNVYAPLNNCEYLLVNVLFISIIISEMYAEMKSVAKIDHFNDIFMFKVDQ